jgi:hypothetical protein
VDQQAMFKSLMGGSGKALKALTGFKRKRNQPKVVKMEDYITDPDMLKDLNNPANQVPLSTVNTNLENFSPKGDVSRLDPSFMGKNQMDNFQSLTDPLAVDRAGRAQSSQELDPVGIKPAMNPPLATPIDIDQQGVNSLYSNEF